MTPSFGALKGAWRAGSCSTTSSVLSRHRLASWQQRDEGLAVELRADPRESLPFAEVVAAAGEGGVGSTERQPLWPLLLLLALVFLAAEAWVLLLDHRARVA